MMPGRRLRPRLHRLVAAAALAVIVPVSLVACTSDPPFAAQVADVEISEEQVDEVIEALSVSYRQELEDELDRLGGFGNITEAEIAEFREDGLAEIDAQLASARDRVLLFLVLTEVATRFAADEGLSFPDPDLADAAGRTDLPEDHPYVEVLASFNAVVGTVLQARSEAAEPTEADQREAFENLQLDGAVPGASFEEFQEFLTPEVLAVPVGIRNLLVRMLGEVEVQVNPDYRLEYQVPVTVGPARSHLGVFIGGAGSAQAAD
jgi:hypothetical protein